MRITTSLTALFIGIGVCAMIPAAQAGGTVTLTDPLAAASACVISKLQAERTALRAVGGGRVLLARCEKDGIWHWSIDIRGATHEYEVWVNTHNRVVRIITQPL